MAGRRCTAIVEGLSLMLLCTVLVREAVAIEDTPSAVPPSATVHEHLAPTVSIDASIQTSALVTEASALPETSVILTSPSSTVVGEGSNIGLVASSTVAAITPDLHVTSDAQSAEFIITVGPGKSPEPTLTPSQVATTDQVQPTSTPSLDSASTPVLGSSLMMTTTNVDLDMLTVMPSSDVASVQTSAPVMSVLHTQTLDTQAMSVDETSMGVIMATSVLEFPSSEWSAPVESELHSVYISTPVPSQQMTSLPLTPSELPTEVSSDMSNTLLLESVMPVMTELYSTASEMTANLSLESPIAPTVLYSSAVPYPESFNTDMPSDSVIATTPPLDLASTPDSSAVVESTLYQYSTDIAVSVEASSVLLLSPTSSVTDVEASVLPTTELPTSTGAAVEEIYTYKAKLRLSGNCSVLDDLKDSDELYVFENNLIKALSAQLMFPANQIRIESSECGSIIVIVHFVNVTNNDNVEDSLKELKNGEKLFTMSDDSYVFSLMSVETVPDETGRTQAPPASKKKSLTDVQIIVIIVCTVVGGTLMIYALGFCVYACYQKKKTKSFDLGETPGSSLTTEDFTLTKLQRDAPAYGEYGLAARNGRSKWSSTTSGQYQSIEDEMQCVAPEDIHLASTLPLRRQAPSGPTEVVVNGNHGTNGTAPPANATSSNGRAGFENPSFSSDDVLDSGQDTDQELPLDTEPVRFTANNGYEKDEGSSNNKTDSGKSEGATAF